LRVRKEIELYYEPFHETLPIFTKDAVSDELIPFNLRNGEPGKCETENKQDKLSEIFDLQYKVSRSNNLIELEQNFTDYVKNSLKFEKPNLFFIDEKYTVIEPVSFNENENTKTFLNALLTSGVIKQIIENKNSIILPDNLMKDNEGNKIFYLLIPFFYSSQNNGCLAVKVNPTITTASPEIKSLKIGLNIISKKLEFMDKQKELKNVYNELQVFQSRLANDYKLSAIGELTTGILEDILTPLQVITSYIDFIKKEKNPDYNSALSTINLQAKKINRVVNRLINFAKPVERKLKLQPCDINEIITEFYNMVISTLKKDNYECILDLDENIPSILSHPNFINQVLMNMFLLLKPAGTKVGGVLLQSRYKAGQVLIKLFTTDYYNKLESNAVNNSKDVNIKIIRNLIRQHQGKLEIDSEKTKGTIITISLPLKRKL